MAAVTVTEVKDSNSATVTRPGSQTKRRGIAGASGGVYVGPVLSKAAGNPPTSITHATGAAAGGVDGSTGYRKTAAWDRSGGSGDPTGSGDATDIDQTRPTGRTAHTAQGVVGGSVNGYPAQRAGQRASAAEYEAAQTGAFIDKRTRHFVDDGAGVRNKSLVSDETVTATAVPTLGTSANPSAGTVALVDGGAALDVDLHADDITGGANGRKGAEIAVFLRGTDTDEDGALVAVFTADGGTDITEAIGAAAIGGVALTAQTFVFYARWLFADANGKVQCGPWSSRGTVAVA